MTVAPEFSSTSVERGSYLSDGSHLFRVVEGFSWPPAESWATLEDCMTLEQVTFTPDELWTMSLSKIEPAERPERLPSC